MSARLDDIEARAAAATPGPWAWHTAVRMVHTAIAAALDAS